MKLTWSQAGILLVATVVLMLGIDWGLPSQERNELLTFGVDLVIVDLKSLDSLISEYFVMRDSVDAKAVNRITSGSVPIVDYTARVGAILDRSENLRGVRRFLFGSCAVDERKPFIALARMNPDRLDFDPRGFMYGGAFLYPLGLLLKLAEALGLTSLTADPGYALTHPRDVATLYIVGRIFGVIAFLGIGVLLTRLGVFIGNPKAGTLALFAWCCSSLALNQALVSKPHLWAAFFSLLGICWLLHYRAQASRLSLILAGLSLGLSAGSSYPAVAMWLLLPIFTFRNRIDRHIWHELCIGLGSALVAFFVTNPYLLINPRSFLVTVWYHGSSSGWGFGAPSLNKLVTFLDGVLLRGYSFPLSIVGFIALIGVIVTAQGNLRSLAWVWLFFSILLGSTIANCRILLFLGPILCFFIGVGLVSLVGIFKNSRLASAIVGLLCLIATSQLGLFAYDVIWDNQWYRPTLDWVKSAEISESTSIGVFDRPEPINHPPFPFLRSQIMNLLEYRDASALPDYVVLGNYSDDRARWTSHPLRQHYCLLVQLGYRKSFDFVLAFRFRSESRLAGWVYKRKE